jgi:hypothetical protein
VVDGDVIDLGDRAFEVLHLPGHSPGWIGPWDAASATRSRWTPSTTDRCAHLRSPARVDLDRGDPRDAPGRQPASAQRWRHLGVDDDEPPGAQPVLKERRRRPQGRDEPPDTLVVPDLDLGLGVGLDLVLGRSCAQRGRR